MHLALATVSCALCFMAWGLVSAFAPWFRDRFGLSATQTALLVAVPDHARYEAKTRGRNRVVFDKEVDA